jgi:hypothetical protein
MRPEYLSTMLWNQNNGKKTYNAIIVLYTIALLFSISLISLPSLQAYADRFDDIDPMKIKKRKWKRI